MDLRFLVALCILAATRAASSSEVVTGRCLSLQCSEQNVLNYQPGRSYVYKYAATTRINSWNADVSLSGDAIITKHSPCEFSLKLANVAVEGVDDAARLAQKLEASPIKFSNVDGLMEEICHDEREEEWVNNIKKAILSSLQISSQSLDRGSRTKVERDLMGDCLTTYENLGETYKGITLKKTKNLMSCRNRFTDSLAGTWEALMSNGQYLHECTLEIDNKREIITESRCKEISDDKTKHKSTIQLVLKEEKSAPSDFQSDISGFKRSSLLFSSPKPEKVNSQQLEAIAEKLCSVSEEQILGSAPASFRQFVQALDSTTYDELKKVWKSIEQNSLSCDAKRIKALFFNAISQSRSGAALKFALQDLYPRNKITETQLKFQAHSLIFKSNPNTETMEAIVALLKSNLVMKQSLFGVTAAIQRYLDQGFEPTLSIEALELIAQQINARDPLTATIIVKALGNVRLANNAIVSKLLSLAENRNDAELAVAAVETVGKIDSCGQTHQRLGKIVKNRQQPIEVRVAAFKAYIRCIRREDLEDVVMSLNQNSDSNFYGYVQSYLNDKSKTMDPNYQNLRIEIDRSSKVQLQNPKWTHSRHWSSSKISRDGLIGFNLEADVVVADDKKVPTWFIVNASIPVQRQNLHNFEIGIRQEGLDEVATELMEKIKLHDWQQTWEELKHGNSEKAQRIIGKVIEDAQSKARRNARVSVYVELNDKTLFYLNGAKSIDRQVISDMAESMERSYTAGINQVLGLVFANYESSFPVASGLNIRYWHVGSVVTGLKVLDCATSTFGFYPNVAADYMIGHDLVMEHRIAGSVRNFTLASSSFVRLDAKYEKGQYLNLTLHAPETQMDLFRIQQTIYKVLSDGRAVAASPVNSHIKSRCIKSDILNMAMCVNKESTPSNYQWQVSLKKTDPRMSGLSFAWMKAGESEEIFTVDTVGSTVPQTVELRLKHKLEGNNKQVKISLRSPHYQLAAEGKVEKSHNKLNIPINIVTNKETHTLRFEMSGDKKVQAKVRIVSPKLAEPVDYDVQITKPAMITEERFVKIFSNSKQGKRTQILMLRASPENFNSLQDFKVLLQVEANCPRRGNLLTMSTTASASQEYPTKLDSKVSYQRAGKQQHASLNAAIRDLSTSDLKNYQFIGQVECSEWSLKGAKWQQEVMVNPDRWSNKLELAWGQNFRNGHTLMFQHIASIARSKKEIKHSAEIHYEPKNFHHKAEAIIKRTQSANGAVQSLKVSHKDLKNEQNNHEASLEALTERKTVQINAKCKTPFCTKAINIRLDRPAPSTIKASGRFEDSNARQNPVYEMKFRGNSEPIEALIELQKEGNPLAKAQVNYEQRRPTDINMSASAHYKDRQIGKMIASRKDSKFEVVMQEMNGNSAELRGEIPRQAVLDLKARDKVMYQMVLKKTPGSENENIYEFKSLTKQGPKKVPDVYVEVEPKKLRYDLNVNGDYYHLTSKAQNSKELPKSNFLLSYDCSKHRNVHKTEITFEDKKMSFNSQHALNGLIIYQIEAAHEKNIEGRSSSLKMKTSEGEFAASYGVDQQGSKLNVTTSGKHDLEISVNTIKNQVARARSSSSPQSTKVRVIYKGKANDVVFKTYGEYKSAPKSLRITSIELSIKDTRKFLASANFAADSPLSARMVGLGQSYDFEVDPWSEKKNFKFEVKTPSGLALVSGNVKAESNRFKAQGKMNLESKNRKSLKLSAGMDTDMKMMEDGLQGDMKVEWQHPRSSGQQKLVLFGKINRNIVDGPHEVKVNCNRGETRFSHQKTTVRGKSLSQTALSVNQDDQKVIDVAVVGNFQQTSQPTCTLKIAIDSAKYSQVQGLNYFLTYQRSNSGKNLEIRREKDDKVYKLIVKRDRDSYKTKNLLTLEGYLNDGTPARFTAKSECSNKCEFVAELRKNAGQHSKLEVKVPLVRITEFITEKASAHFQSPFYETEAAFEIDAQATNNILVRAHVSCKSQPIISYKLQVNNGETFKPYGIEALPSRVDAVLFDQELKIKGAQVMEQKILVSQKAIAANLMIGSFSTRNSLVSGDEAHAIGQTCFGENKKCAEFKVKLAKRTSYGAKYDASLKLVEQYSEEKQIHWEIEYDMRPRNEKIEIVSTYKNRSYGIGAERVASSSKNLYKIKAILPARTPEVHLECQTPSGNRIAAKAVFYHDSRKEEEKMVIDFNGSVVRSGQKNVYNHLITLSHSSIGEPFIIESKVSNEQSRSSVAFLGLKAHEAVITLKHGQHFLTLNENWDLKNQQEFSYKFSVFNQDKKINFGCNGGTRSVSQSGSADLERTYKCIWTDRNGEIRTAERQEKIKVEKRKSSKAARVSISDYIQNPFVAYKMVGELNLADLLNLAQIDLTIPNGPTITTKVGLEKAEESKCLVFTLKSSSDLKAYSLRTCVNQRPTANEPILSLYLKQKDQSEDIVAFQIVRMADFARDFKVSLKWNTNEVSEATLGLVQFYEKQVQKRQQLYRESVQEVDHKINIVKSTFGERIFEPMQKYWRNELARCSREMEPESLALKKLFPSTARKSTRFTRSIHNIRPSAWRDSTSPITFEWVVKDFDGGDLEFIIRNVETEKVPLAVVEALASLANKIPKKF